MSRDITKADPLLQEFWPKLERWYADKYPGYMLFLTHVDRTPAEQLTLFCIGRNTPGSRVTNCDGYNVQSKHNATPSKAFDVAVRMITGMTRWEDGLYAPLGLSLLDLGYADRIRWGGSWKTPDMCHFEVL